MKPVLIEENLNQTNHHRGGDKRLILGIQNVAFYHYVLHICHLSISIPKRHDLLLE